MKYANHIKEMINAFSPEPLEGEQMEAFYCEETMEYRMSDKYSSPMEDIFETCQETREHKSFLLLGHKGCGKSTELNRMSARFEEEGYHVKTIVCSMDLDLLNMVYSDIFILMGEALLEIAEESGCCIGNDILCEIHDFWDEKTELFTSTDTGEMELETGGGIGTPGILENILKLFAKMKVNLKYNEETRKEYRKKISTKSSEWIALLSQVAKEIEEKNEGRQPIIIFEDLDKLNPEDAWEVFYNYAAILSGMSFPVIYTFPIALSYDTKFAAMESYFMTKTLPMIKIEKLEGGEYESGIQVIEKIVEKRTKLELFEEGVLKELIKYTGGSLRDLFHTINAAAKRADRRKSSTIAMEDAMRALEELKTSLTRRIEQKDYEFLVTICKGNKEQITDKEMLLKMLQASVVLEYNGKHWHNVHPLVAQFLKDQGLMENGGN